MLSSTMSPKCGSAKVATAPWLGSTEACEPCLLSWEELRSGFRKAEFPTGTVPTGAGTVGSRVDGP